VTAIPDQPVWHLIESDAHLGDALEELVSGTGPIGVDAERASGFRYGNDAYLVQFYRAGSAAFLIDPRAVASFEPVQEALAREEWIFHAASQDLPCLRDIGLEPTTVFDTELASRLLGLPRVGLSTVAEELLGVSLAKAHSAADWSTRPLPEPWLEYAALDVTLLPSLRDALATMLDETNKSQIAQQEFEALLAWSPKDVHPEPWRRLSGLHSIHQPRNLAIARELWQTRDALARDRDTAPGRLLPDRSIIAAAQAPPRSQADLASMKSFSGRASRSELSRWWEAIYVGKTTEDLPTQRARGTREMPHHRAWSQRYPEADARLKTARASLNTLSEQLSIPLENLLTPDFLRRLAWEPPDELSDYAMDQRLAELGARPWQRELCSGLISEAFRFPNETEDLSPGNDRPE
jgi:ribonuclease D